MNKRKTISTAKIILIIAVFTAVIIIAVALSYKTVLRNMYPLRYTEYIDKYSEQYDVPAELLYAVIKTESGFDKDAKSKAGAIGLSQITPETFAWLQTKTGDKYSEQDLYDPEVAVKYCAVFYRLLLDEFQNTETSVAAYHAGRSKVNAWLSSNDYSKDGKTLENIPSSATAHYVNKVTKAINIYLNLYKEEL